MAPGSLRRVSLITEPSVVSTEQVGVAGGGASLRLNIHHNHRKLCSATEPVSSLVSLHCTKYTHIPPDLSLYNNLKLANKTRCDGHCVSSCDIAPIIGNYM